MLKFVLRHCWAGVFQAIRCRQLVSDFNASVHFHFTVTVSLATGMEFLTTAQLEEFEKMSPAGKKTFLRNLMSEWQPEEESHKCVAKMLFDIEDEDAKYSAMDSRSGHAPKLFDVLINDITDTDLMHIGDELGAVRLSTVRKETYDYPVTGLIYGPTLRVFVPLVVKKRHASIYVHFLFDTGSPNTYLREDTMRALGFTENVPSDTMVTINGVGITAYLSRGHFENVDLMGQDWMAFLRAKVALDYGLKTVEVHKGV